MFLYNPETFIKVTCSSFGTVPENPFGSNQLGSN